MPGRQLRENNQSRGEQGQQAPRGRHQGMKENDMFGDVEIVSRRLKPLEKQLANGI